MCPLENCNQIREQISGYLDNELTQQESQRIALHIEQCNSCKQLYEELNTLKGAVSNIQYPNIEQDKLDEILNDKTTSRLQVVSWAAIVLGFFLFALVIVFQFYSGSSMSLGYKVIISLVWAGCIGLFISVLRHRLIIRKTDKYNKVKL